MKPSPPSQRTGLLSRSDDHQMVVIVHRLTGQCTMEINLAETCLPEQLLVLLICVSHHRVRVDLHLTTRSINHYVPVHRDRLIRVPEVLSQHHVGLVAEQRARAAAGLNRDQADGIVRKAVEKYQSFLGTQPIGVPFAEAYDPISVQPRADWLATYHKLKEEAHGWGLPFD